MTQPNILVLMVDQLSGTLFPDGPADWLHAPNLKRLAARSARYTHSYCASPLCGPSRASFMTGQLPSATRVYDNAAELSAAMPTYAHHLRRAGYQTALSGKMHFVGPDQLHGFEERLTTDIYPADFGWTPDYTRPGERIDWWYHNMGSVTGAGVAETTNQLEYDDEVAFRAVQKVYDFARGKDARPWMLTVSFTHPHDPYVARRKYWDLYEDCAHLDPEVPAVPYEAQDPHSQRLLDANDWRNFDITPEDIRRSRRAYFANISYLDDKIGEILDALEATRQEAVIVFTADHGDMLGEGGMWFKMSFREGAARVPLMISGNGFPVGRFDFPVSGLDVTPTLAAFGGAELSGWPYFPGEDLFDRTASNAKFRPWLPMEYAAEGSAAPMVALIRQRLKFIRSRPDPDQLFDLETDPYELHNLADDPDHAADRDELSRIVDKWWDLDSFDEAVRASQAARHATYAALRQGRYQPWEFRPDFQEQDRFMRNHMDLNVVEENQRFPRGE